jgi:hypothetical protein
MLIWSDFINDRQGSLEHPAPHDKECATGDARMQCDLTLATLAVRGGDEGHLIRV